MRILRRTVGSGVILLSSVGLILCVGGVFGGWLAKNRADALGDGVLGAADDSLTFVEGKLDQVREVLSTSRKRVGFLSDAVERLRREEPQAKAEARSLLKTLDEEVFEPLRSAETWLDSTHAVAVGVGRVSEAVVSSEFADSHQDSVGVAMAQRIQEYSESVAEILATLKKVRQELVELGDAAILTREIVKRIVARLVDVETRLANIRALVDKFDADVGDTKAAIADLKQSFHWWTAAVAIALTSLFAWFGISQIVTMRHGWGLACD